MVESRCGLKCSECSYRESHGCGGCVETNGKPFHGECRVATCCQDKGLSHCGQCSGVPCEVLYHFSHLDQDHHDHPRGKRIEQVKLWADAEKAI